MEVHALHATFLAARAFFRLLRWIGYFRFTNKFVGLKVIFLPPQWWMVLAILDISEAQWEVSGRPGCLHQNLFFTKKIGKNNKQCSTTSNNRK